MTTKPIPEDIAEALRERFIRMDDRFKNWFCLLSNDTRSTDSIANWIHAKYGVNVDKKTLYDFREGMKTANRVTFRPNKPKVFEDEQGYFCVNKWEGWKDAVGPDGTQGDIEPFMTFIGAALGASPQEVGILFDTVAVRLQRDEHIPYGLLFMGDLEASSIILNTFSACFGKNACGISSSQVFSRDRRWISYSSLAVVRDGAQVARNPSFASALSNLIMSPVIVNTGTSSRKVTNRYEIINRLLVMIASEANDYAFSYSGMHIRPLACMTFQVLKPSDQICENVLKWLKDPKSAGYLTHWLLNRNIKDFETPHFAPPTQYQKILKKVHNRPFQVIAQNMRECDENMCAVWVSNSLEWADSVMASAKMNVKSGKDLVELASSIRAFMPEIKICPFYTAAEIAQMFPEALETFKAKLSAGGSNYEHTKMVGMELISGGLPFLVSEDPRGFLRAGIYENFFVVHDFARWHKPLSQKEFDELYDSFGTYRDYTKLGTYGKVRRSSYEVPDPGYGSPGAKPEGAKNKLWWRANYG